MTPVPIPLLSCQVEKAHSSAQMETQLNPTIKLRLRRSPAEKIRISVHCPLVEYLSHLSRMSMSSVMRYRLVNCGRDWPLWTHMRRLRGTRKEIPGAHRREMALLLIDLYSTMYLVYTHKHVCRKRRSECIKCLHLINSPCVKIVLPPSSFPVPRGQTKA